MTTIYVLTHEYSDKSRTQICGITMNETVAIAWSLAGDHTHAYKLPLDQIKPVHPDSEGWPEYLTPR